MANKKVIKQALQKIFEGIGDLRREVPSKKFTIDGRLVGDIGEAIVQREYDVELYDKLVPGHDGETSNGRRVQIKATFKDSLTFTTTPDYYLGIKLYEDGEYDEIYNGPGNYIESHYSHRKGLGEKLLSFPISKLLELSSEIEQEERVPRRIK